ncbi:class I adenylate-forming enzyme family protein [Microbacterium maritypicum]|uniref:class I adenylate-forming enzyme family protein n=1 Tax=Microbacterium maritypicum TaxID=33918 RepID=UPI0037FA5214
MLRHIAAEDPDRPAIVGRDARMTYGELHTDSRRISAALAHAFMDARAMATSGAHPPLPPVVAICLSTAFDTARAVVAVEAGARILTVIDAHWPVALQMQLIVTTGAAAVITDVPTIRAALHSAGWSGLVVGLDGLARTPSPASAHADTNADANAAADDAPFLMLTSSGTTGPPKAFLKTRRQYAANIDVSRDHLGARDRVATFAPGPMSYSLTLYTLFEVLATGGRMHVADRLDELWLSSRVHDEHITRLVAVPAAVTALTDAARRHPARYDGIDLIVTGGAGFPASARAAVADALPHARTISYFGTGELGFIGDDRAGHDSIRLYPQVEARVRGDDGSELAPGELGSLWVRSPSCSAAYLAGTAAAPLTDGDGWASVHDQGRLRGRDFTFVGRAGDVVTTGGHTVALDEVERAFDGMPGLSAWCAIAESDDRLGLRIALVTEGDAPPAAELRRWARERLAPAARPRRWHTVAELPRTAGGKIRRAAVADLVAVGRGRS